MKMYILRYQLLRYLELILLQRQMDLINSMKFTQVPKKEKMNIHQQELIGGSIQIEMMHGMKENLET